VLMLCSHLGVTIGFPMSTPGLKVPDASHPFPCQNIPCGCRTAELCWQGDCCCFTLEQKLAWAEANGIEPPEHVRPMVAARKHHPPAPIQPCCSESECDERPASTCCSKSRAARPGPQDSDRKSPPPESVGLRWVIGFFAHKCRGDGPAGLFHLDSTAVFDLIPTRLASPEHVGHVVSPSDRVSAIPHRPLTPPPRRS